MRPAHPARAIRLDRERMVDRDVDRQHRVQHRRVDAGFGQHVAHRGDVDQGRRAGRVVHQHAARLERDLGLARAVLEPAEDRSDRGVALRAAMGRDRRSRAAAAGRIGNCARRAPPIAGRSTIAKVDPPTVSEAGKDASVFSMTCNFVRATEDRIGRPRGVAKSASRNQSSGDIMHFPSQALRRRTFSAALLAAATGIGAPAIAQSPLELKMIGTGCAGRRLGRRVAFVAAGHERDRRREERAGRQRPRGRRHRRPGPVRQPRPRATATR